MLLRSVGLVEDEVFRLRLEKEKAEQVTLSSDFPTI
jgi:hypothetical protein